MPIVIWKPSAAEDLDEIWLHVAIEAPGAADRLIDALLARGGRLSDHPMLGPSRPDLGNDARMLVEGDYLILYRVQPEAVEIVRVVHGARRLNDLFEP